MEERKMEELIAYLAGMEFRGEKLESEIRKHIRQGVPYFSVRHILDYGDERMFYDLRFRRDHQFDAYRLEGYKATHRKPVKIDHQIINGIDTKELKANLSTNPDAFELKCFRNEPEGYAEYVVPVTKVNGDYFTDYYTVSLTPYPPIDHDVFNGIDTGELETKMQKIDWHNDHKLFTLHEDQEPELKPQVEEIVSQINQLSKDANGNKIAGQLQLKYWTDAGFLDSLIEQRTWDYLESLPKRIQQFPVEMKARTAFNLLCGRAALNTNLPYPIEEDGTWMRLDLSHKDESGNYPIHTTQGFPTSELEKRLDLLPIDNMDFYSIRNALEQGDILQVRLRDGREVKFLANPEQKTIDIFTQNMRSIHVNLMLDPEWQPSTTPKEKILEMPPKKEQEMKQNHFFHFNKKKRGRGRRM